MNELDSELVAGRLRALGYRFTRDSEGCRNRPLQHVLRRSTRSRKLVATRRTADPQAVGAGPGGWRPGLHGGAGWDIAHQGGCRWWTSCAAPGSLTSSRPPRQRGAHAASLVADDPEGIVVAAQIGRAGRAPGRRLTPQRHAGPRRPTAWKCLTCRARSHRSMPACRAARTRGRRTFRITRGLQQVLHLLRGPVYARGRGAPAAGSHRG
jgi:hypothetical protein